MMYAMSKLGPARQNLPHFFISSLSSIGCSVLCAIFQSRLCCTSHSRMSCVNDRDSYRIVPNRTIASPADDKSADNTVPALEHVCRSVASVMSSGNPVNHRAAAALHRPPPGTGATAADAAAAAEAAAAAAAAVTDGADVIVAIEDVLCGRCGEGGRGVAGEAVRCRSATASDGGLGGGSLSLPSAQQVHTQVHTHSILRATM